MHRTNLTGFFLLFMIIAVLTGSTVRTHATEMPVLLMTHMKSSTYSTACCLMHIYSEAFERLGYRMQYTHVPAARASAMADHGELDGELGRSEEYGKYHPNMVRIEEPHLALNICVYTRNETPQIMDWETLLKRTRGIIAYIRGVESVSRRLETLPKHRLHVVNSATSGLMMLKEGRVKYFVSPETIVDPTLLQEPFSGTLHKVAKLGTHNGHAYLHIRHKKLASKTAEVLREMKAEGLFEEYYQQCGMRLDVTP